MRLHTRRDLIGDLVAVNNVHKYQKLCGIICNSVIIFLEMTIILK